MKNKMVFVAQHAIERVAVEVKTVQSGTELLREARVFKADRLTIHELDSVKPIDRLAQTEMQPIGQRGPGRLDLKDQHLRLDGQVLGAHVGAEPAELLQALLNLGLAYEPSPTHLALQTAAGFEIGERSAHRHAADAQRFGKLALGRQRLAGLQVSIGDGVQDLVHQLLIVRRDAVRIEVEYLKGLQAATGCGDHALHSPPLQSCWPRDHTRHPGLWWHPGRPPGS